MTIGRRTVLAGALASPLASSLAAPAIVHAQEAAASLRDLARRATIYLFPVYEMYRTRWQATVNEANPQRQRLNRFRHLPELADHRARAVTTPNPDTLYSSAWLDLSLEPLFLTVPPVGDLYYSYRLPRPVHQQLRLCQPPPAWRPAAAAHDRRAERGTATRRRR